jgi:hypothetical protein
MVKSLGGIVLYVIRPGIDANDVHVSETALDSFKDWDGIIINDRELIDLEQTVKSNLVLVLDWAWGKK